MVYPADMHIHSSFSFDGHTDMESMLLTAQRCGLKYAAFTEHLDLERFSWDGYEKMLPDYFDKIASLNERYGGQITALAGVEIAEPHKYPEQLSLLHDMPFDYILGSVHYVDGLCVALRETQAGDPHAVTARYYEIVLEAVQAGGFDALAHLDHIRRGVGGDYAQPAQIAAVAQAMVSKGVALEINTSGARRTGSGFFPDADKTAAYRKAGGQRVTIGSDAHAPEFVGQYAEMAASQTAGLARGVFIKRRFVEI